MVYFYCLDKKIMTKLTYAHFWNLAYVAIIMLYIGSIKTSLFQNFMIPQSAVRFSNSRHIKLNGLMKLASEIQIDK